ncbi:sensor histidine kinase [Haliscomenobacter sp.]|uniref:sensor histidine kinase n=1 Tax=Haliscomenobacter sp. TaxID=2717303 RepID=UPI003364F179
MRRSIIALLHVGYWFLYGLLWALVILLVAAATRPANTTPLQTWRFIYFIGAFGIIPAILGFYTFYTWLFPQFLQRGKILALFLVGLAAAIGCGVLSAAIISVLFPDFSFFNDGLNSGSVITTMLAITAVLNGSVGLVIKGFISWYNETKLKEILSQKNFEMELALVKSQINPHFLFNTLNNIDVLIGKDAVRASLYLNKLSDIMRFMLYETKTEKIPLSKELAYIEKYIDLQRIRTATPNYVEYIVVGEVHDRLIEPMLFIPLVENAFKHSAMREKENAVQIHITIADNQLIFDCTNKYKEGAQDPQEYGGLGIALIQKRLLALYPKKHQLEISKNGDTYQVKLTLNQTWKSAAS